MRPVQADHIFFRETLYLFLIDLNNRRHKEFEIGKKYTYIATTFEITKIWDFNSFKIHPSLKEKVGLDKKSFISKLEVPNFIDEAPDQCHKVFGEIIATILSFISLKACKSPTDTFAIPNILSSFENFKLGARRLADLHLTLPFRCAGPGAINGDLKNEDELISEYDNFLTLLLSLEDKDIIFVLETLRIIHLSLLNKRQDFGLSFSLVIAAIEAIAQEAISDEKYITEYLNKPYKNQKHKNIKARFIEYIFKYCPPTHWKNITHKIVADQFLFKRTSDRLDSLLEDEDELRKIIEDTYTYRCDFIHSAKQPPHRSQDSELYLFDISYELENDIVSEKLIASYELMLAIFKFSLFNRLQEKVS